MYPQHFAQLFPAFPLDNKVFVAMSFDTKFDRRWNKVIKPAISQIEANGAPLEAFRVDARTVSDSILTEIMTGISRSRLIFADITTIHTLDNRPQRNGNVMYEIGLAHALRLPEEVLLFRSDRDPLLFDVQGIRLNYYDPDSDAEEAIWSIRQAILDSGREIDLKRNLAVESASRRLDLVSYQLLIEAIGSPQGLMPQSTNTMGEAIVNASKAPATAKLLDLGALYADYQTVSVEQIKDDTGPLSELMRYKVTPFGEAIVRFTADKMGLERSEIRVALEQKFSASMATSGRDSE